MKRTIFAFVAGQAFQIVALAVGMNITYATNLLAFCAIIGIMATLMLLIGSVLSAMEVQQDIDEVPPIPEDIKVTNDKVERVEELHKAVEAAQRRTARAVEEVR